MNYALDCLWALDVEGSGTSPPEIVELAAVEVRDFRLTGQTRTWRVRPSKPITSMATSIHGVRNRDVASSPPFVDIAHEVDAVIGSSVIVGHNVHVEVSFLTRALPAWKPNAAVDTLRLAKSLKPGLASYGLGRVGQALLLSDSAQRITGQQRHSALYDATLSALILIQLISELPEHLRQPALRAADIFDQRQGNLL